MIYKDFVIYIQMEGFEQQIQNWVSIDNQLRLLNEKTKLLREKKNEIGDSLTQFAEHNNLNNATIQINDGKLKFITSKIQPPLTFKHLEKSLSEAISDDDKVKQLVKHIKDTRETKVVCDLKRFTNN
jgi:hypothetical protein